MLRGERMIAAYSILLLQNEKKYMSFIYSMCRSRWTACLIQSQTIWFYIKFSWFICHNKLPYTITITLLSGLLLLNSVRLWTDEREEEERRQKKVPMYGRYFDYGCFNSNISKQDEVKQIMQLIHLQPQPILYIHTGEPKHNDISIHKYIQHDKYWTQLLQNVYEYDNLIP